jgi:AmiR/NasT family two-component response regulator
MGKRFLIFLLIVAAAFLVYKQVHRPLSEQEQKVRAVEDRFEAATSRFMGIAAGGLAGGLDSAEAAVRDVQNVRNELARLMKTLTEDKAIARAEELQAKVEEFCRKNDIR